MRLEVPEVYRPCFTDFGVEECRKNLWYSPRTSWKSSGLGRIMYVYYELFPDYDVCVGVDSVTNEGEGVISEFRAYVESEGLNDNGDWVFTPKSIYRKGASNRIRTYAVQTTKRDNVNVTKSKKLVRPVSLFVMDEVQKLHSRHILDNCLSTFLRQMKTGHSKVILAGNPDRSAMWFDEYYKSKLKDKNWTVLKPTYKDIIEWIPDALLDEIEHMKIHDPVSYAQIYLGDLEIAGWEQTFHSFVTSKHYKTRDFFIEYDKRYGAGALIQSLIMGIDDAESRDAIAGEVVSVRRNGLLRVEEGLYLSCKELPQKPALTERIDIVIAYLDYIQAHFNPDRTIPIIMTFDCASGMYRQMLIYKKTDVNYMRWRGVKLFPYTNKQDKEVQLDLVNSAFANGVLAITNVDNYSPQYSNAMLVEQIKALRYKENGKIDPIIPNDCTDALQYAVMTVLQNPYNLTFPERRVRYELDNSVDKFIQKLQIGEL